MTKVKIVLLFIVVFLVATFSAFFFEEYYRELVRCFFKFFSGEKITFIGKNFHLFASNMFVLSFGIFSVILLFHFYVQKIRALRDLIIMILLFFATTIVASYIGGVTKILACAACGNGKLNLNYNGINYDLYFVVSQACALFPVITNLIRRNYKSKLNYPPSLGHNAS